MATENANERLDRVRDQWNKRAATYTEIANKRITVQCAKQLYANMQLETAQNVIEVAAGAGICAQHALELLAQQEATTKSKKNFVVTDLAPVMVELARTNLSSHAHTATVDVCVQEANGQDLLEIASGSMDRYLSSLCLQLCPDPEALLREAHRVLKSDGIAGFTIWGRPECSGLFRIDAAVDKEVGTGDGCDHANFAMGADLPALRQRFQDAGFTNVMIWPFLCVVELWSGEEFAAFYMANTQDAVQDPELRVRRGEIATRLANEWLAKGFPIGLETYIIIARR